MKTNLHLWSYLTHFFLQLELFRRKIVQNIKTHILCSIIFFFSIIVPFVRKCVKIFRAGQATDDNVIRRTRIACWITMATDTHSEFFLHCNMVARTRLTVRYTSIACLVQYWFTFAKKLSTIHCCVWSLLADINGCGISFACVCIAVTCC